MKFKKALIFVLCAIMSFSVVACSKNGTGKPSGDDPSIDIPDVPDDPIDPDDPDDPNKDDPPKPSVFTVTFDVGDTARENGITDPAAVKVESGKTISPLPQPDNYGSYVFNGWFAGEAQFTASTAVYSDMTLIAKWVVESEYEKNIDWAEPGHLYIHYYRYKHSKDDEGTTNAGAPDYTGAIDSEEYGDRGLWLWPKNGEGRLFNAARIDESGAVYDILIDHDYTDGGWDADSHSHKGLTINYGDAKELGFQLFSIKSRLEEGFWSNDGGNNYITMSDLVRSDGIAHWYVEQGKVFKGSKYYPYAGDAVKPEDPYKDDDGKSKTSKCDINSSVDNSAKYPLAAKAAGYDDAGVGYQIFIASFCDSDGDGMGDLQGIISKLGYLQSLNVDVLWLTPFQTSTNYHGYDIKDYFSVDSRFGTLADYRQLVYEVHKRGMKIVMDFVLNHTAQSNPWFVKSTNLVKETVNGKEIDYRNFYNWINEDQYKALGAAEKTQWYKDDYGYYFYSSFSSDMPELNYDYQPVRDAILDVCNYWMEFGLDGFRLDAVKHIYMKNEVVGTGRTASTGKIYNGAGTVEDGLYSHDVTRNLNFYREFNYRLKANYPNAFLVGENLDGNPLNTTNYYQGLDSQFNFNLYYDAARAFAATQQYNNSGDAITAVKKYFQGYYGNDYDVDKDGNTDHVKGYSETNPHFIDGLFTSNHDLPRARDRMNITTDANRQNDTYHTLTAGDIAKTDMLLRMYYAFIMTVPGLNWIYYGDEIGMSGVMASTVNSGSTSTTESLPHEDRIYRQPMKWFTDISKNASYEIGYETYKNELVGMNATDNIKSVEAQENDPDSLLGWMRRLTKVRNDNPVLIKGKVVKTEDKDIMSGSTINYTVTDGSTKIKVYINAGDYDFNVSGEVIESYGMSGKTLKKGGIAIVKG